MDYLITEPASVYQEKRANHLSSHALADFRRCPRFFRDKQLGLIPDKDTRAYAIGRAAHVLILEGRDRYESEFAVGGPINEKTGKPFGPTTKAFAEWADTVGKPVINEADAATVSEMNASVHAHPIASKLLASGEPEKVVRADHCGVPCQIRMDWFDKDAFAISDLKTCASIDTFEADAIDYGYIEQMAFYRELLADVSGREAEVHLIAIEKRAPYRCGVWTIDRSDLDRAAAVNIELIEELKACKVADVWPTRFEDIRVLSKGAVHEFA